MDSKKQAEIIEEWLIENFNGYYPYSGDHWQIMARSLLKHLRAEGLEVKDKGTE